MIGLTSAAEAQLDSLIEHFENLDRIEATRSLLRAIDDAKLRIERSPPLPREGPTSTDRHLCKQGTGENWRTCRRCAGRVYRGCT